MRKILTLLTVVVLITLSSVGQAQTKTNGLIGKVMDNKSLPVPSASVSLLNSRDSALVKIAVTNKEGRYEFANLLDGTYIVFISTIGYSKNYSTPITLAGGSQMNLEAITLTVQSKDLKAVTISTKKQLIEQRLDRTVVNVDAAVTNVGASALEVLEKSPGISVDKDGNISLKGKQGVQVYIDGRPSYLSGTDLANLLRNMNAAQLDQIEIMTNPPAKYDAAGNSGIINIKTKKTKQVGYNGSLSLGYGQGRYPKINESININYRKNKINLFASAGYSYRKNFNDLFIQRKFIEASTKELLSHFDQESRIREKGESFNGKIGMDFYATKKTTIGFVLSAFNNPGSFANTSDVNIADPAKVLQSITRAGTINERSWKNLSSNFNFRHVFDTTGKELTADVDILGYRSMNDQRLVNAYFTSTNQPFSTPDTLLGNLPQHINIYSVKLDYILPMKKGAKLEAGIKSSFVNTDNDAIYDSLQNNQKVRDIGRSNHFAYKENVNAVYINYSRPLTKKISGQFGLRLENTRSSGNQITSGQKFDRNYTQLFPTAFLQYTVDKNNTVGLNYGRRIQRPNYEDLNPFIVFLDKYTFERGNPMLQPQFSHNVEISHTFKGFLTTTLNYTKTTDIITEVLEQNPNGNETYVTPSNIASQRQYGISVSAGVPITKWLNSNIYANVYNNLYKGIVNNDPIELGATTGQFNISNQIKINKTISAELGAFYRTAGIDGIFSIRGLGAVNAGISKQIMKGKGSIRLSVRDLFWTQKIDGTSRYSNIDAAFQQVRDSRVFSANFNYRFSKGKSNAQKRRTGGVNDEQNRIKVEGNN
ncbi:MAG: TonB-dependent receptor domain-containing protein [Chitinophagaceae bacterium]